MPSMTPEPLDETEGFVKILYYGDPKKGKTTAMAGAAHLGTVIAIDTEGQGWLRKPLMSHGIPVENILKFRATSYQDMEQIYWEVHGMFDDAFNAGTLEAAPVAVCVDHLSDLEARLVTAARVDRIQRLKSTTDINTWKNEWDDYGVWTNQARHLMRKFRDLPCHVAFAAHSRTDIGKRVPALTEKFRVDLMGSMNMVVACDTMKVGDTYAHVGYTREVDGWQGGDRFNATKPIVVNPSFDRIISAAQGKLDFDTDEQQQGFKRLLLADN